MKYIYRTQLSIYNNMKTPTAEAARDTNFTEMTDIEEQEGARAGRLGPVFFKVFENFSTFER